MTSLNVIALLILGTVFQNSMAKFDFLLEKLDVPARNKYLDMSTIKSIKVNRSTYAARGKIEILELGDNTFQLEVWGYQFQGNEYRKTPFRLLRQPLCEFLKEHKSYYEDFIKQTDIPPGCPIPKGSYNVDYIPDASNLPDFMNGKYMIKINGYKGVTMIADFKVYVEMRRY